MVVKIRFWLYVYLNKKILLVKCTYVLYNIIHKYQFNQFIYIYITMWVIYICHKVDIYLIFISIKLNLIYIYENYSNVFIKKEKKGTNLLKPINLYIRKTYIYSQNN